MIREAVRDPTKGERHFRWRSPDVSRIENLSDIIFGLNITLIASTSVPASFGELTGLWRDLMGTAGCFAIILVVWDAHYRFFRRYDLQDGPTIVLNSVLLFLVVSFAYPLKFILSFLARLVTGGFASNESIDAVMTIAQGRWAMLYYALTYASIFFVFMLLYRRALSQADRMALNPAEIILTRSAIWQTTVHVGVALLVAGSTLLAPTNAAPASGILFFLIWPLSVYVGRKEAHALEAADL